MHENIHEQLYMPDIEQACKRDYDAQVWITRKSNKNAKKLYLGFHNLSFNITVHSFFSL